MQNLDVCRKETGKIWHRKPLPNNDGLVLSVTHTLSTPLSAPTHNIRFLHAAFDASGDSFIASDYQGNVYLFDIARNKFSLVQRCTKPCTALAFAMRRRTEFLVALSDYSLKCFDTETKELVAWMKGHDAAIHTISVHASGRYALTSSASNAQLWDLDTFQRKRKLNIKENVGIIKVFFLPLSNTIVSCFKDDSIFGWDSESFSYKFHLHLPEGKSPGFKDFATTRDGRILVAGGRCRYLYMWSLDTHKLQQVIELPSKVTCVKQLEFLPSSFDAGASQVLGVLGQDGVMRFIDINSWKCLFDVGGPEDRVAHTAIAANGRYIIAVMDSGNVNCYSVEALASEVNQPPAPLVKVLKSSKMADTTRDGAPPKKGVLKKAGQISVDSERASAEKSSFADVPDGLNLNKLFSILKGLGEYPEKYRSILRLPENHAAYGALVDKGTHPSYEKLHETYPIKSRKLSRGLQRVLSALAHWAPIFGELDFLPLLTFPMVKLFQNNHLVCFEVVATILTNWCQHWFEYFPNPPINVLGMVENMLAHHDKELLSHFVKYNITSQMYAWPMMQTLLSEVMTREEWLKLWDNIFSAPPAFLLAVVVAYCTTNRGPLLKCTEPDDFKYFFHHRNAVDVVEVIKEAYILMDTTPCDIHPQNLLEGFTPLTKGQYPVFNKYPRFIVDYQVQERERIRSEEMDYLRQQQVSLEMQQETIRRQQDEEAWYRQQQLLLDAEDKRRKLIVDEEQKLTDQRTRLTAMARETKLKELQTLDATRRKFLQHQQHQKESELARLDDEIRRKAEMRELETTTAMEDVEIKNMELQLQRKLLEQELFREAADTDKKAKTEYDARRQKQDLEARISNALTHAEDERGQCSRKALQENLAHAEHFNAEARSQNQIEHRYHIQELDRERRAAELAKVQAEKRQLEEQVQEMMLQLERSQMVEANDKMQELAEQQESADARETRRLQLLEDEVEMGRNHIDRLDHSHDTMRRDLHTFRHNVLNGDVEKKHDRYINDTESEHSAQYRGRHSFEEREKELMAEVRKMRQKLAHESRTKRPPPEYNME